jgi:hypothetical protein
VSFELDEAELRVFGALIEKELATPDYYPMSLNALVNACNQKTNRDPVTDYGEATVTAALESSRAKGLTTKIIGDRVPKYGHRGYEALNLGRRELALLAVLALRGPQTAAELKERAQRLHEFNDLDTVETCLRKLSEASLTVLLERQPGRREARWAQLLAGEPVIPAAASSTGSVEPARGSYVGASERLSRIEEELAALRSEFDEFKRRFE